MTDNHEFSQQAPNHAHEHDDAPPESMPAHGRIAVVEDGEATRSFLVNRLRAEGYLVKGIEDGGSALPLLRLHQPDLILLDVTLPGMSGYEVCRQIRGDPLLREATVIMLTGHASNEDRIASWHAGADDFLIKPCEIPELLARVSAAMRHREVPERQWRNPLTQLAAPAALEDDLVGRVQRGEAFALCYADIAYFKSYNNRYGYLAGDGLLVMMADLLRELANDLGEHATAAVLAGHLGSDDFCLITPPELAAATRAQLTQKFHELAPSLYQGIDRERGWVPGIDEAGDLLQFPLVHLTMATVVCQPTDFPLKADGQPESSIIAHLWQRMRAIIQPAPDLRATG
jgi:PleD family two-component response regulator